MADSGRATFDPAVLARLRGLPRGQLVTLLRGLSEAELRTLHESWAIWALPGQREPAGDWQVWLIRAGRGFGKTRAGAEWVSALARAMPGARIAMVGGTMDDVRKVMVEGESGLIAVAQAGETYRWRRDAGEFVFDSGARAFVYSAEAPEKLRGPEHHAAWCDELAKWRYGDATWDNLMMGLRIGIGEMVTLFWHCLRDCPEGLTRERLGEAVVEAGLAVATPVLRGLLRQILAGR